MIPILTRIILPYKFLCRLVVIVNFKRRKVLQHGLACMHGQSAGVHIDDPHQFKGVCHNVQESLLLPHRIRYIRAHKADSAQAKVYLRYCHILGTDIPFLIHDGI